MRLLREIQETTVDLVLGVWHKHDNFKNWVIAEIDGIPVALLREGKNV